MTEEWKRRLFGIGALTLVGLALGYIAFSDMGEEMVFYWSPTELMQQDNRVDYLVRLGGQVEPGSIEWDKEAQTVKFAIADGETTIPVFSSGNPPQMFRNGIGVVVEGKLAGDGVFNTDKIIVKHSNEYKAPEGGEDMAAMAKTLEE